jgi:integrase
MNDKHKTISEIAALYSEYRASCQRHPYGSHLIYFLNFCKKRAVNDMFDQAVLDEWCKRRNNENNNTHYNRVKAAEEIIHYANKRGYCDVTINVIVKWEKPQHRLVMLKRSEIVSFFKACDENPFYTNGLLNIRGSCYNLICGTLFRLLYSNGLRPIEARLLRVQDVDLTNGIIYIIQTKGYREHVVVLSKEMQDRLKFYHLAMSELVPNRIAFFCNEHGTYLHRTWISDLFHKLWKKYNQSNAVPYDFRHNYAIENLNALSGLNIDETYYSLLAISKSMGHATLNQTMYYYSLTPQYSSVLSQLSLENLNYIIHKIENEE